jgi:hypothetical protein
MDNKAKATTRFSLNQISSLKLGFGAINNGTDVFARGIQHSRLNSHLRRLPNLLHGAQREISSLMFLDDV